MNIFKWRKGKSAKKGAENPDVEVAVAAVEQVFDAATMLLEQFDQVDVRSSLHLLDRHLEEIRQQGQEEAACQLVALVEEKLSADEYPAGVKALLGNVYQRLDLGQRQANLLRALELYQEAEIFYGVEGEFEGRAIVLNNMGGTCMELAAFDPAYFHQAIPYLEEALLFYEAKSDIPLRASICMVLGECYLELEESGPDHFELARDYYERAWALYERQADRDGLAASQGYLGDVQVALGAYKGEKSLEKAVQHYRNALGVYIEQELPERCAFYQMRLAETYIALSNMESEHLRKGMRAYERSLELYDRVGKEGVAADIRMELARLNIVLQDGEEVERLTVAVQLYLKALNSFQKEQRFAEQGAALQALARIYLRAGDDSEKEDVQQAIRCLEEAGRVFHQANLGAESQIVREELGAVRQVFGEFPEA